MLKRLMIAVIGIVGLVVVCLGIASATVWRADDVLVATTSGGPHTLVTDPGVLELGGDPVTVKVTVPDDGKVVLAIGRDTDVAGWVGTDEHGRVTGLSGWHTLEVEEVAGPEPTPAPTDAAAPADGASPAPAEGATDAPATVADPSGSDLWVAEETGTGSAELVWPAQEGRWSLLAVSTGESAPTLSLAWPRVVTTPWLWPCVAVGALLMLVAAWLMLRDVRRRRAGLDDETWHPVSTGAVPVVTVGDGNEIPVLTRRELREAAQARAARPRTGSVPKVTARTGSVPVVAAPKNPTADAPATTSAGAAAVTQATVATSRRSLRPPTGAIPVVPQKSATDRPAPGPGWTPTAAPGGDRTSADATAGRPTSAPVAPTTSGGPGPARPTADAPPHGRPSWVAGTSAPATPVGAPATGPNRPADRPVDRPAGWTAVPPPPGARVRPGSPDDPGAAHAGRPAWARTDAGQADQPGTAGSRADAWRRAWGLPATDPTPTTQRDDHEEENR
ncbi:hypothetical protein [Cellulomonas fengjieae]|uniref:hypothetical protein n=1 Tax=Cellulomonas fengjieae TaxID=2819978 RepID=UPI001AAF8483|nr:hypothetical protein [Cellulomonas fengjieae]MBO3100346.1 hypothetical protein [Cellulomonas fengjieae]